MDGSHQQNDPYHQYSSNNNSSQPTNDQEHLDHVRGLSVSLSENSQKPGAVEQAETRGTPIKLKRAGVACKRCRRLRGKCTHEGAKPPCVACREAGPEEAAVCSFPLRGEKDSDREFRRKRTKASERVERTQTENRNYNSNVSRASIFSTTAASESTNSSVVNSKQTPKDLWELLPPYEEVAEGCRKFMSSFFQLGFIPKALFLERLANDRQNVSVFFLFSILSLSARFTPCLLKRYGSGSQATEYFLGQAAKLVPDEMYEPTLERTQAFFLLGMAEWGNGDRNRSIIHMGIAVRMAGIMGLHREETYKLLDDASSDEIVASESARRTFWVLQSQDNLHSGHTTPASFSLSDITTLLPCEESDFAFALIPRERAALPGTRAALLYPELANLETRSLFASLIQTHEIWGTIARRAMRSEPASGIAGLDVEPWSSNSEYALLTKTLSAWTETLPKRHRWSIWNLRGYKAETLDLAFLSVCMPLKLCGIVVRRVHLEEIMASIIGRDMTGPTVQSKFWENMSYELFENVLGLYEQIDAFFTHRACDQGFPALIVFCVYICGSLASYLWKWPQICPAFASGAQSMLDRALEVLESLQQAWPTANRWHQALQKVASPSTTRPHSQCPEQQAANATLTKVVDQERSFRLADGLDRGKKTLSQTYLHERSSINPTESRKPNQLPISTVQTHPLTSQHQHPHPSQIINPRNNTVHLHSQLPHQQQQPHNLELLSHAAMHLEPPHGLLNHYGDASLHSIGTEMGVGNQMGYLPNDDFEAELAAFMQGMPQGMLDGGGGGFGM